MSWIQNIVNKFFDSPELLGTDQRSDDYTLVTDEFAYFRQEIDRIFARANETYTSVAVVGNGDVQYVAIPTYDIVSKYGVFINELEEL